MQKITKTFNKLELKGRFEHFSYNSKQVKIPNCCPFAGQLIGKSYVLLQNLRMSEFCQCKNPNDVGMLKSYNKCKTQDQGSIEYFLEHKINNQKLLMMHQYLISLNSDLKIASCVLVRIKNIAPNTKFVGH